MAPRVSFRTCPLCEATCGLRIETEDGRVTRIRGDVDDPFSKGYICPKGSTLGALHDDPDRLRRPLLRRNGAHEEASWEEAFAEVERRLTAIVATHGPDAVAVYIGNPNAHNFANTLAVRPLVKALRTKNVYSASTVDQMPKHVACGLLFGHPLAIPVPDLDRTDFLLLLGANPLESNGSLATAPDWPGRLEAIRRRGGRVIVVDPRRTRTAEHADLHVPIRPGTDAALLAGIARHAVRRRPRFPGALTDRVDGIELVARSVAGFTPKRVSSFTGVAAETVVSLARELAAAPTAVVYGRIGTHTTAYGTLAAWLVDVLNVITGNLDRPGGAMFPHAAHERPRRRPRAFRTGRWHSRVRGLPEAMGELPVATLADEIETSGTGQVRALLTIAGNPALTTPDAGRLDRPAGRARADGLRRPVPERDDPARRRDPAAALRAAEGRTTISRSRLSRSATWPTSLPRLRARPRVAVGVRDPRPPGRDRRRCRRRRRRRGPRRGRAGGADRRGRGRPNVGDPRS